MQPNSGTGHAWPLKIPFRLVNFDWNIITKSRETVPAPARTRYPLAVSRPARVFAFLAYLRLVDASTCRSLNGNYEKGSWENLLKSPWFSETFERRSERVRCSRFIEEILSAFGVFQSAKLPPAILYLHQKPRRKDFDDNVKLCFKKKIQKFYNTSVSRYPNLQSKRYIHASKKSPFLVPFTPFDIIYSPRELTFLS